jgi:hypothetical protein
MVYETVEVQLEAVTWEGIAGLIGVEFVVIFPRKHCPAFFIGIFLTCKSVAG